VLSRADAVEDVLQEIRTRLFVGDSPKIASYRGRGCLAGWLRRVAVHAARDYQRSSRAQRTRLSQLHHADIMTRGALRSQSLDALDDGVFQRERLQRCQQAWNAAIRALEAQERQMLYHHFVHGVSIDVLGALYGVHRATVARRIRRATAQVRRHVRNTLALQYEGMSSQDLDGLAKRTCCEVDVMQSLEGLSAA
jgi:RNA polymerase sigma-70 factor (ECF subfamily)